VVATFFANAYDSNSILCENFLVFFLYVLVYVFSSVVGNPQVMIHCSLKEQNLTWGNAIVGAVVLKSNFVQCSQEESSSSCISSQDSLNIVMFTLLVVTGNGEVYKKHFANENLLNNVGQEGSCIFYYYHIFFKILFLDKMNLIL
jgi:hypothetical protein